jgi:hypothetical protein
MISYPEQGELWVRSFQGNQENRVRMHFTIPWQTSMHRKKYLSRTKGSCLSDHSIWKSWAVAKRYIADFKFADPKEIIRVRYSHL